MATANIADLYASTVGEGAAAGLLPAGPYTARVETTEATTASTGKPMIKFRLAVVGGPYDEEAIFGQFVLTTEGDKAAVALRIYFQQMAAFGLDGAYMAQNPTQEQIAAALIGRHATVVVKHKDGNVNISAIKPLKAEPAAPQPPSVPAAPVAPSAPTPPAAPVAGPPAAPTAPAAPPVPPAPFSV